MAIGSWWRDRTARDLGQSQDTVIVGSAAHIRDIPLHERTAGDMLVTADGVHVMAFLDDGSVIEADPLTAKVTRLVDASDDKTKTPWLDVAVTIVRWRELS